MIMLSGTNAKILQKTLGTILEWADVKVFALTDSLSNEQLPGNYSSKFYDFL